MEDGSLTKKIAWIFFERGKDDMYIFHALYKQIFLPLIFVTALHKIAKKK